jgi:hypothetical protein
MGRSHSQVGSCRFTCANRVARNCTETAADVAVYGYVVDDPSLSTELPGK